MKQRSLDSLVSTAVIPSTVFLRMLFVSFRFWERNLKARHTSLFPPLLIVFTEKHIRALYFFYRHSRSSHNSCGWIVARVPLKTKVSYIGVPRGMIDFLGGDRTIAPLCHFSTGRFRLLFYFFFAIMCVKWMFDTERSCKWFCFFLFYLFSSIIPFLLQNLRNKVCNIRDLHINITLSSIFIFAYSYIYVLSIYLIITWLLSLIDR